MKLKQIITGAVFMLTVLSFANADTLGFRAGTGIWQPEQEGTFRKGGSDVDLKKDLFLKDDDQTYTYAILEHPLPMIPNIKISQTTLASKGAGTPTAPGFEFDSTTFNSAITTEMVLDHSDITLYYQLLDNWLNLDFGITARKFDGKLVVSDGTTTKQTNIDQTVPMLYAAAGIAVPGISDLFVGVEVNMIEYDGSTIKDYTTKVSYTTSYLVGFEAGLRVFTVELDNVNNNYSNMEYVGSFANLYIHF